MPLFPNPFASQWRGGKEAGYGVRDHERGRKAHGDPAPHQGSEVPPAEGLEHQCYQRVQARWGVDARGHAHCTAWGNRPCSAAAGPLPPRPYRAPRAVGPRSPGAAMPPKVADSLLFSANRLPRRSGRVFAHGQDQNSKLPAHAVELEHGQNHAKSSFQSRPPAALRSGGEKGDPNAGVD